MKEGITRQRMVDEEHRLKEPVLLECQRCHNKWTYSGRNPYFAICTWCKSTVLIQKHKVVATAINGQSFSRRPGQSITVETHMQPKDKEVVLSDD